MESDNRFSWVFDSEMGDVPLQGDFSAEHMIFGGSRMIGNDLVLLLVEDDMTRYLWLADLPLASDEKNEFGVEATVKLANPMQGRRVGFIACHATSRPVMSPVNSRASPSVPRRQSPDGPDRPYTQATALLPVCNLSPSRPSDRADERSRWAAVCVVIFRAESLGARGPKRVGRYLP
ncbi:hypothetical protein E2562_018541 [Oryza meyeriana var. granulata]|uniref:Uncharacterized protein n=1 Tax=Oryza meyeriana var. granulata TaxID=110450 RepID=A0A6G1F9B5_9ORYZ|nr:hypothetical protein E2562_018541 [Oryza meyeriana var. granulata]